MYAVAFDVELDRLVPEAWGEDTAPHITCAAVFSEDEGAKVYFTRAQKGIGAPRLELAEAAQLLDDLWGHMERGALIISWGGTAVDFRALHAALRGDAERQRMCLSLVRNHIDIPIASATDMGMMMGLDAAAQGTGLGAKSNQVSADAPRMWSEGMQQQVLEHVKLDAMLTLRVYTAMMARAPPCLTWATRSGRQRAWFCYLIADTERSTFRLGTVVECMQRPMKAVPFDVPLGMNRDAAVAWIDK